MGRASVQVKRTVKTDKMRVLVSLALMSSFTGMR